MNLRLLGIDHGENRIGLAISDQLGSFAHPYRTLQAGVHVIDQIRTIVRNEQIGKIVIGLPKNMDGTLGLSAAKAKSFSERLAQAIPDITILLWDERLTTLEAQRVLHTAGKNTRQSKKMIDQVAAQILLQNYMDSLQWVEGNQ